MSVICLQDEQNHCKNNNYSYYDGSNDCSRTLIEAQLLGPRGHVQWEPRAADQRGCRRHRGSAAGGKRGMVS